MLQTNAIANRSAKPARFRLVSGWILCLFIAYAFLTAGGMKLLSKPVTVRAFQQVGLGQWFRYFTGILEVSGAIGLLIPKWSQWAAILLGAVLIGAVIAHLTVLHSPPVLAITLLALTALAAWLRR